MGTVTQGGECVCGSTMTAQVGRNLTTGDTILWWTCDDYPEHRTDAMRLPSALSASIPGVIRRDNTGLQPYCVAGSAAHPLPR